MPPDKQSGAAALADLHRVLHRDAHRLLALGVQHMDGAGDAGIEAVDGAQDLDGLLGVVDGMTLKRCFVRTDRA